MSKFRKACYDMCLNDKFEIFIMVCIIANTIILAIKWYDEPKSVSSITELLNFILTIIFTIEAGIKLYALGPKFYFKDSWNVFDFIIVCGAMIGAVLGWTTSVELGP
jgi:voltage-dependent calcium channel L type alpha-1D